jgi:elongation factor P--(R)-beta-lysine ligase
MNLNNLLIRQSVIQSVRNFFLENGFNEFTLPTLNPALPLEPNIYAFAADWQTIKGNKTLYLSTSPESGLKKILAKGTENIFSITPAFRNIEAISPTHLPEFLMLEWYRKNADVQAIMDDTQNLIKSVKNEFDSYLKKNPSHLLTYQDQMINLEGQWPIFSLIELWEKHAGMSLKEVIDDNSMRQFAESKNYNIAGANWEQLFNQIFLNEIEPKLGFNPCFVTDYPSRVSPLCKPNSGDPDFAQRFELYLGGMELGNGNAENTELNAVSHAFTAEKKFRNTHQIPTPPIDESFLNALTDMKNNSFAGMGLGIDRLTMILADISQISEVNPFSG